MEQPLISIVTPSYNQRKYLEYTLQSVINQDYENVEHIIIDGGSTDGTVELLEEYSDIGDIKYVSEPDDGQSDALNKGFAMAEGKYVGWINSDDMYFHKGVFEKAVSTFVEKDDIDIIYSNTSDINKKNMIRRIYVYGDFDHDLLEYGHIIPQPGVFFRERVVDNNKLREDLKYCLDGEYWIRLARNGYKFYHIDDIFAAYRRYNELEKLNRIGENQLEKEKKSIRSEYDTDSSVRLRFYIRQFLNKVKGYIKLVKWFNQTPPVLN